MIRYTTEEKASLVSKLPDAGFHLRLEADSYLRATTVARIKYERELARLNEAFEDYWKIEGVEKNWSDEEIEAAFNRSNN